LSLEIHVLGTSSARPAHGRSVSGSIIETPDGIVVVDCGEGFQNRLVEHKSAMKEHAGRRLRMKRVGAVLLTHGHLDHTWGLLPWLQTMSLDGRKESLTIIGPTTTEVVDVLLTGEGEPEVNPTDLILQYDMWMDLGATSDQLGYDVKWVIGDGERWVDTDDGSLIELPQPISNVVISAHPTQHTVPSCAWRVATATRPGKFDRDNASNLPTEVRTRLAAGEDVEYEGETLIATDFRAEERAGLSVIISGDTAEQSIEAQCDLLIHEATFLNSHADIASEHLHSTAAGAARTALECGAKYLALTHYSARLENLEDSIEEAQAIHESVVACNDGDRLLIEDNGNLIHLQKSPEGWLTL